MCVSPPPLPAPGCCPGPPCGARTHRDLAYKGPGSDVTKAGGWWLSGPPLQARPAWDWASTFGKEVEGEEVASLGWVLSGLAPRAHADRGLLAGKWRPPAGSLRQPPLVPGVFGLPVLPGRPWPGWVKDHSALWLLDWPLDSQPFQGCRGQAALTVTSESWEADGAWARPHWH